MDFIEAFPDNRSGKGSRLVNPVEQRGGGRAARKRYMVSSSII
jgi:hypothetical protein